MVKICPNCGTINDGDETNFCMECGTRLVDDGLTAAQRNRLAEKNNGNISSIPNDEEKLTLNDIPENLLLILIFRHNKISKAFNDQTNNVKESFNKLTPTQKDHLLEFEKNIDVIVKENPSDSEVKKAYENLTPQQKNRLSEIESKIVNQMKMDNYIIEAQNNPYDHLETEYKNHFKLLLIETAKKEIPTNSKDKKTEIDENIKPLDINNASVDELTTLPGINIISAKKVIQLRNEGVFFNSVEEFGDKLNLKTHQINTLKTLIIIGPKNVQNNFSGRKVDF